MSDLCDRQGCTVVMAGVDDHGQTFGWMRRVGMDGDMPVVRIYCSQDCVEADRE